MADRLLSTEERIDSAQFSYFLRLQRRAQDASFNRLRPLQRLWLIRYVGARLREWRSRPGRGGGLR